MPSVHLSKETFDRVCALAASLQRTPEEIVQSSIDEYAHARERTPEERQRDWDALMARFDEVKHTDETEEELMASLKTVTSGAWAERAGMSYR